MTQMGEGNPSNHKGHGGTEGTKRNATYLCDFLCALCASVAFVVRPLSFPNLRHLRNLWIKSQCLPRPARWYRDRVGHKDRPRVAGVTQMKTRGYP